MTKLPSIAHIVYLSYSFWPPYFGGELKICIERLETLAERGYKTVILTSGVPGYLPREERNGLEIHRSPIVHPSKIGRGLRRLVFPLWACVQMMRTQFDILHLGGAGGVGPLTSNLSNWLVCKVAKWKKVKTVWVHSLADTESEFYSEQGFDRKLRKLYLTLMDVIVCVSPALHVSMARRYPNTALNLPYGIRDDIFQPLTSKDKQDQRNEFGVTDGKIVFSFLGTLGARKGIDTLIQAFEEESRDHPNWILWLIGPYTKAASQNVVDEQIQPLIRKIEDNPARVCLWGRVDDRAQLAKILASSDVFVFPTRREGMPLSPHEAMATGIPIIISRIPGVTDLANVEGETGLYIEPGSVEQLRNAMVKLAEDQTLRREMGRKAHRRIVDSFSWLGYIDQWESIYTRRNGE